MQNIKDPFHLQDRVQIRNWGPHTADLMAQMQKASDFTTVIWSHVFQENAFTILCKPLLYTI